MTDNTLRQKIRQFFCWMSGGHWPHVISGEGVFCTWCEKGIET